MAAISSADLPPFLCATQALNKYASHCYLKNALPAQIMDVNVLNAAVRALFALLLRVKYAVVTERPDGRAI